MKNSTLWTRLGIAVCTIALVAEGVMVTPRAFGFDEDHPNSSDLADHSSFHYELMRGMAYKAGFTRDEAEIIAVACQCTDLGSFTGNYTSSTYGNKITVKVTGTERKDSTGKKAAGPQTYYWHFPRRSSTNILGSTYPYESSYTTVASGEKPSTGKYSHESRNTCQWFTTQNTCPNYVSGSSVGDPELTNIEKWAFLKSDSPAVNGTDGNGGTLPSITATINGKTPTTSEMNLIKLGLYLHSLGDSYSHEAAMQTGQVRTHTLASPYEAVIRYWHDNEEFGKSSDGTREGYGVPFALEAGRAAYLMLCRYRTNVLRKAGGSDFDAMRTFTLDWAKLDSEVDRDNKANTLLP